MKKIVFLIVNVMVLLCFCVVANALESEEGYYYTIEDGEVTITGHRYIAGDMTVPAEIEGCPVTAIGSYAFKSGGAMTSITLPESVTTLGYGAFYECESLKSIYAPGVVEIGDYAFFDCSWLTKATFSENIKMVGRMAFTYTTILKMDVQDGVYYIGTVAVEASTNSIGDVVSLREGTTCVAEDCFNSNWMTGLKLPASLKYISEEAFYNCYKLQAVVIPDTVEWVGDGAFASCDKLMAIKVGGYTEFEGNPFEFDYDATVYSEVGSAWHILAMNYGLGFDTMDNAPAILYARASDDLNCVNVVVETKNAADTTLFAIGYDADGERVAVKRLVNGKTTFPTDKVETVEVFCWDSFKNLMPHCNSVKVDVIKRTEFKTVTVSQTPQSQNHKGNLTDGDFNTAWACSGEGTIVIDLGESKDIRYIDVYFKEYNDNRTLPLKIHYSTNNSTWYSAYYGTVTRADGYMNTAMVRNNEKYRYIKITVDGSSIGAWSSVAEVEVYCEKEE